MVKKIKIKRAKYIIAVILFIFSFFIYLKTLSPTIFWGDSAELVTVAATLGIAHPTGYPLYTLLGKLFTFLPFGSIAFRVNLMSGFFASLTVVFIFFISLKLTKSKTASFVASLMLAFSRVFWSQSVFAEVYTLFTFFISLLIFVLIKWHETRNLKYLYLLSFLFGLSLTNHVLTILLMLPFAYYILKTDKRLLDYRLLIILFITFLIGLSVYAYLPIRSLQNPAIDWNNPETLSNFIDHVTAASNRAQRHFVPLTRIPAEIFVFISLFVTQFTLIGFFIGILGIYYFYRRNRNFFFLLMGIIILNLLFKFYSYNVGDVPQYYLPSVVVFSVFIAAGFLRGFKILYSYISSTFKSLRTEISYSIVLILFLIIPFLMLITNYPYADFSSFDATDRYANYILNEIKPNAVLITKYNEDTFPIWYYQIVEGKRKDINVVYFGTILAKSRTIYLQDIEKFFQEKYSKGFNTAEIVYDFIERNIDDFDIYTTPKNPILVESFNNKTFPLKKFEKSDLENKTAFLKEHVWSSEFIP